MRLAAIHLPADLAARPLAGSVHSVFSRAVNLRAGGFALTTVCAGADAPPGAIVVAPPAACDFSRHVRPGAVFARRAGVLRFAGSDLTVDLRGAAPGRSIDGSGLALLAPHWTTAWRAFVAAAPRAGFALALYAAAGGALDRALAARVRAAVPALMRAAEERRPADATDAADRLAGAGPGLTPSGDDFLAGFIYGLRRAARSQADLAFVDGLAAGLTDAPSADIARHYLAHAAAGRVGAPLARLGDEIAEGDGRDIADAVTRAMQLGHSSGADATFGLLCGLAAWHGNAQTVIERLAAR